MEGLTAYVSSERYIHISCFAIPYNNANVATLKLKQQQQTTTTTT